MDFQIKESVQEKLVKGPLNVSINTRIELVLKDDISFYSALGPNGIKIYGNIKTLEW